MQRTVIALLVTAMFAGAALVEAGEFKNADPAKVEAAIKSSWTKASPEWQERLGQDDTMRDCSTYRNSPPKDVSEAIEKRERAAITYPADGKLLGDWKKGEKLAQSGYGMRFSDYPPRTENGGNCYACHELDPKEVSFGTMGPSLRHYGKLRKFAEADVKAVYEKIYNPHAVYPCSLMPRFGTNKFLTMDQIKDLVALLMDPESPVNK